MKVLVTGVCGQLGFDVMNELLKRGHKAIGSDIKDFCDFFKLYFKLDITNQESVNSLINSIKPDAIIHCAAWTAVDKAEENKDLVYKVNALGPKYLAIASKNIGASMLHVSTDYVFNGKGEIPFEIDSPKEGLSTYGKTKSVGEDFVIENNPKHFIVRTTGVFGKNGNNFVKTMLKLANIGKTELNVVNDQIVSVTYSKDLAKLLVDMIETNKYGIYHAANGGYFPWCDFAKEIFKETNKKVKVNCISTDEYMSLVPGQTERPKNSRLSMRSLDEAGFARLPDHLDALKRYLKEIGE